MPWAWKSATTSASVFAVHCFFQYRPSGST